MGIFKRLMTPSIPDIDDTVGVVEWFFSHDDKISDAKDKVPQPHLDNLKSNIIEALRESRSAEDLQLHIDDASATHDMALQQLYAFHQMRETGQPSDQESVDSIVQGAAQGVVLEASFSAALRIYGYFMLNRFNQQPRVAGNLESSRPSPDRSVRSHDEPDPQLDPLVAAVAAMRSWVESPGGDATAGLLRCALPSDDDLGSCLEAATHINRPFREVLYLRIFAVDLAVMNAFAKHPDLEVKREQHLEAWRKLLTDEQHLEFAQRFAKYKMAMLQSLPGQSATELLGRSFAESQSSGDAGVALAMAVYVRDVLNRHVSALRELPDARWN